MQSTSSRQPILGCAGCALVFLALAGLFVYSFSDRGAAFQEGAGRQQPAAPPASKAAPQAFPPLTVDFAGVREPVMIPAEQVMLDDDEIVIGVEAAGESRAYLRQAFADRPDRHIVHDQLGSLPVAVTYCERTDSTRVFAGKPGESSLDLRCGGWLPVQEMSLLVGEREYAHSSPHIPLADVPFVVTTWKEWRESKPDSLIYLGPMGAESD